VHLQPPVVEDVREPPRRVTGCALHDRAHRWAQRRRHGGYLRVRVLVFGVSDIKV